MRKKRVKVSEEARIASRVLMAMAGNADSYHDKLWKAAEGLDQKEPVIANMLVMADGYGLVAMVMRAAAMNLLDAKKDNLKECEE